MPVINRCWKDYQYLVVYYLYFKSVVFYVMVTNLDADGIYAVLNFKRELRFFWSFIKLKIMKLAGFDCNARTTDISEFNFRKDASHF